MWHIGNLLKDGNKVNSHLVADSSKELKRAAKRLHAEIHSKGNQQPHLDLNAHQAELAKRYGAKNQ